MTGEESAREVSTLADYLGRQSWPGRARSLARSVAMRVVTAARRPAPPRGWIRFPYYHHVFDDERKGFERQLKYFRARGDMVSIDDAVGILESDNAIDGSYFCITFDDGFLNNFSNAVPILSAAGASAAFFVPTMRIRETRDGAFRAPHAGENEPPYLTWSECRAMLAAGMTIGSHSVTHARLSALGDVDMQRELRQSKLTIEKNLGIACNHFACPWGQPMQDFTPGREPAVAREAGYRSFLTTRRGSNRRRPDPFAIERDQLMANWGDHQLRYFFER